jgi:hypothetical protein
MRMVLFSQTIPWSYKQEKWGNQVSSVWESVKKRTGREPPFRENWIAEAVTREQLVKTKQAGKD